jgi:hypothetical protein
MGGGVLGAKSNLVVATILCKQCFVGEHSVERNGENGLLIPTRRRWRRHREKPLRKCWRSAGKRYIHVVGRNGYLGGGFSVTSGVRRDDGGSTGVACLLLPQPYIETLFSSSGSNEERGVW